MKIVSIGNDEFLVISNQVFTKFKSIISSEIFFLINIFNADLPELISEAANNLILEISDDQNHFID